MLERPSPSGQGDSPSGEAAVQKDGSPSFPDKEIMDGS